jgi:hypothetical protein
MAKDPLAPENSLCDFDPPSMKRAAPAPEYRKPRRVERQGTRANRMIAFLAAGNRKAALDLVDGEDMARRLKKYGGTGRKDADGNPLPDPKSLDEMTEAELIELLKST